MRRFGLKTWKALTIFTITLTLLTVVATAPTSPEIIRQHNSKTSTKLKTRSDDLHITQRNLTFESYETIDDSAANLLVDSSEWLWRDFQIVFRNMKYNYSMIVPEESDLLANIDGNRNVCNSSTRVFVFVPTRPDGFERRESIRRTWGEHGLTRSLRIVVRFIVGHTRDLLVSQMLFSELATHKDFILNNIPDTYENLFLKVYAGLQWQRAFCEEAEFVLKIDDDTILHPQRLSYWIDEEFRPTVRRYPLAVFGTGIRKNKAIREPHHRWYVPFDAFPSITFPPYVTGAAYLMSNAAVESILCQAPHFNAFAIEDALFNGILGGAAGVHKFDAVNLFRGGMITTEIYEYEKCDNRQEPFVLSLYGFPDEQFENQYKRMLTAKCLPVKFFNATELQPFVEL